ncbi:MAG: carboxypeptidase-like regulatory domain-containing protein, partial [Prevotella sp.]|nr:carboxypeptidase-like regulatory domain-containing protein [Prevotella sp.]
MKIRIAQLALALALTAGGVHAQELKKPVSISNMPIEQALNKIEKSSDYVFLYDDKNLNMKKLVSLKGNIRKIKDVLDHIFQGTNIAYQIVDKQIILSVKKETKKQATPFTLKGTVRDKLGEPLVGVSVKKKNGQQGTITDIDGHFSLPMTEGGSIELSYVGYTPQTVKVDG